MKSRIGMAPLLLHIMVDTGGTFAHYWRSSTRDCFILQSSSVATSGNMSLGGYFKDWSMYNIMMGEVPVIVVASSLHNSITSDTFTNSVRFCHFFYIIARKWKSPNYLWCAKMVQYVHASQPASGGQTALRTSVSSSEGLSYCCAWMPASTSSSRDHQAMAPVQLKLFQNKLSFIIGRWPAYKKYYQQPRTSSLVVRFDKEE
jgi:hypothetical protein